MNKLLAPILVISGFLATGFAEPTQAQSIREWNYPAGSCPPNQSIADSDNPAEIPEGHYFPALPAAGERPALNYALTVSRRPCGFNLGTSELRLRFFFLPGLDDWRPRLTVVQDGIVHGCTGVNWPQVGFTGYPGECEGANGLFVIAPQVGNCPLFAINCVNTDAEALRQMTRFGSLSTTTPGTITRTLSIRALQTSFDPDRAFTLRLRGNWPAGAPDVVYEVPANGAPGNRARIPQSANGMWWSPAESGTALVVDRNERGATFAAWLTYDDNGQSTWFFMSNGTSDAASEVGEVTGTAFAGRGEPFSAPGSNMAFAAEAVGRFSLKFLDHSNLEFRWAIHGRSGVQHFQRFEMLSPRFGTLCSRGTNSGRIQQVRELPGWAAFIEGSANVGNGCKAHATLLTYDDHGRAMWVYGGMDSNVLRPGPGFSISPFYGALFRPSGTPYGLQHDPNRFSPGSAVGVWDGNQIRLGATTRLLGIERFFFEY